MKLPKQKSNLYLVERKLQGAPRNVVVGAFSEPEYADDFKSVCEQDFYDRGFTDDDFKFDVTITSFYG